MSSHLPAELSAAIARAKSERAATTFSPLAPFLPEPGAKLHHKQVAQLADAFKAAKAWETELLCHANGVLYYLEWSYADLCEESRRIPGRLRALASVDGKHECSPEYFIHLAQRVFGIMVPGRDLHAQLARVLDARFWRRALWKRIGQKKEMLHLKLGLIGKNARAYCSADALKVRRTQRQAQAQWLKNTMLSADIDGERVELPMESIAKTSHQKLSRLYAFIAAMDKIANEKGLEVALVTATLEGPWHPNPSYAKPDHQWNGKTPGEAGKESGARWQRVRRDLDKKGIAVSGLWTTEPHRDGCPHRHFWLIYDPEHRQQVFAAFLGHFPDKLKKRDDNDKVNDVIYATRADALANVSRPLKRKREGAQVDVSIINRNKGSGASYVIKYVSKAIGAEVAFGSEDTEPESKRWQQNLQAIDAYRAIWGLRGAQFFGIHSCLNLWDELRRVKEPPVAAELLALWRAARGGDAKGSIDANQQRGDAYAFLQLQGGLAAARKQAKPDSEPQPRAKLYRSSLLTQYGECGTRIEGVELAVPGAEALERVPTRTTRWTMTPKAKPKAAQAKAKALAKKCPGRGGQG